MPVISGFAQACEYRCDGSDNSGGLTPAELIAMATISIARHSEGVNDDELNLLADLASIGERWTPSIPDNASRSMILLPYDGEAYYAHTITENGKTELTYYSHTWTPGSELIETPEGTTIVRFPCVKEDSIGVKVTPLLDIDRQEEKQLQYEKALLEWTAANSTENEETPTPTEENIAEFKEYAENNTACVNLQIITIANAISERTPAYVYGIDGVPVLKETKYEDKTTWTPALLDSLGFLGKLNGFWSS